MKQRTLALAGLFAKTTGFALGMGFILIAIGEAINGLCACRQSGREG